MADPKAAMPLRPSPEVLSLFSPATSLTPIRIFVSLSVLLVFLLVAFFSPVKYNKSRTPVAVRAAGGKGKTRTVLLVGPLAAGKTALFSKLVYGHVQPSYTSMKENEAIVSTKWTEVTEAGEGDKHELIDEKARLETPVHLVDIPGHPRLRTRSLAQNLPAADGIVFTIDGAAGLTGKNVRDAAEHLHVLLSLLALYLARQPNLPPLLILLTKSDLSGSSASGTASSTSSPSGASKARSPTLTLERAKQSLLRELERRRLAATGGGSSSGGAGSNAHSAPLSAGAKLEGLDAIPLSSSGGSGGRTSGIFGAILSLFGLGGGSSALAPMPSLADSSSISSSSSALPSDENELLSGAADDVFAFEGACDWDKLANAVGGVEIRWQVASVMDQRGIDGVYEWVEEL